VFLQGVYRLHGLPRVLVSDRDPKFVSGFWQTRWRRLGTRLNKSSSRHPKTNGLTERVKSIFQHLLRCFCCYDGTDWTDLLPQEEFTYNASRALGIEHTPFDDYFGFSHEEPPYLLFNMRPSIPKLALDAAVSVCSAFLAPRLPKSLYAVLRGPSSRRTERG
jgi:hypothetical protein